MFDISKVTNVYSGRRGCRCGCRGKYSYALAHKDERPSYYKCDDGISDRSVKVITQRVEEVLRDGRDVAFVIVEPDFIDVNMTHDRVYTLYFAE